MSVKTVRTYICNGCHQEIAVCQARDLDFWRTVETHWSGAVYCEHTRADDFTHYCPDCWAKITAVLKPVSAGVYPADADLNDIKLLEHKRTKMTAALKSEVGE